MLTRNMSECLRDLPASYVVACAVILQVLDLRPLVTMTANSYIVFGLRPVTVWLSAVVSADWTHNNKNLDDLRIKPKEKVKSRQKYKASVIISIHSKCNIDIFTFKEENSRHNEMNKRVSKNFKDASVLRVSYFLSVVETDSVVSLCLYFKDYF